MPLGIPGPFWDSLRESYFLLVERSKSTSGPGRSQGIFSAPKISALHTIITSLKSKSSWACQKSDPLIRMLLIRPCWGNGLNNYPFSQSICLQNFPHGRLLSFLLPVSFPKAKLSSSIALDPLSSLLPPLSVVASINNMAFSFSLFVEAPSLVTYLSSCFFLNCNGTVLDLISRSLSKLFY